MSTPAVEEYLELLYRLKAADHGVRPAAVARHLGVSTAAVAEMLNRLEDEKLIYRSPDRTVRLAEAGAEIGQGQVRKHRLLERLLHGFIGRPWDTVHEEACRFEHAMSDELTESLAEALGQPTTCPHGNPIPSTPTQKAPADEGGADEEPLAECRVGRTVVVVKIVDERTELLKYLLSLGLLPGSVLHVEQVAPLGGPLLIRVGEARYAIGRDVAAKIWIREAPPAQPEDGARPESREPASRVASG